jgi:hypothetical protein
MTFFKTSVTFIAISCIAGFALAQDPVKEYSSDNRLMDNVTTLEVLENGMVIHGWDWNDTAKALDPKYGASEEEGGYKSAGLIAQDVAAKYADAVIEDASGYLTIDLPVLIDQDEVIAKMVLEGEGDVVRYYNSKFTYVCFHSMMQRIRNVVGMPNAKRAMQNPGAFANICQMLQGRLRGHARAFR